MEKERRYTFRHTPATALPWWKEKSCVMFGVQTFIGVCLLTFCAISLWTVNDCHKEAPYWGLVGTLCGFFFRKVASGRSHDLRDDDVTDSPGK